MRIGMSLTSSYPRQDDIKMLMDNLIARVELMAELGLDSLSLGDHHITYDHYFQVLPTMCRMHTSMECRGPPTAIACSQAARKPAASSSPFCTTANSGGS